MHLADAVWRFAHGLTLHLWMDQPCLGVWTKYACELHISTLAKNRYQRPAAAAAIKAYTHPPPPPCARPPPSSPPRRPAVALTKACSRAALPK